MKNVYAGYQVVWVFNGAKWQLPSGVFSTREQAEEWIEQNHLTGMLTAYPLDISVYDWMLAVDDSFTPTPEQSTPEFKQKFTHALMEHYHYEGGKLEA